MKPFYTLKVLIPPTLTCQNNDIFRYCVGVLTGSAEDFESGDDLYDAVGDILHEVAAEKDEDDVR